MSETTTATKCQYGATPRYGWGGNCSRKPSGSDGFCTQHRTVTAKRKVREDGWKAQARKDRFRYEWREAHPESAYQTIIACRLCGMAIQTTAAETRSDQELQQAHIAAHGQDWLDYEAAAAPPDAADQEATSDDAFRLRMSRQCTNCPHSYGEHGPNDCCVVCEEMGFPCSGFATPSAEGQETSGE